MLSDSYRDVIWNSRVSADIVKLNNRILNSIFFKYEDSRDVSIWNCKRMLEKMSKSTY